MARKQAFRGCMPDGKETGDVDDYIAAWDKFTRPLCEVLDLERIGYDPGLLAKARGDYGPSVDLPSWLLKRLNAALFPKSPR